MRLSGRRLQLAPRRNCPSAHHREANLVEQEGRICNRGGRISQGVSEPTGLPLM